MGVGVVPGGLPAGGRDVFCLGILSVPPGDPRRRNGGTLGFTVRGEVGLFCQPTNVTPMGGTAFGGLLMGHDNGNLIVGGSSTG